MIHWHALSLSWSFLASLHSKFEDTDHQITGSLKNDLNRIAEKIVDNPFKIRDMIRATIAVKHPNEVIVAYKRFKSMKLI